MVSIPAAHTVGRRTFSIRIGRRAIIGVAWVKLQQVREALR